MLAEVLGKDTNASLSSIEEVATYKWLLTPTDQSALRSLLDKVVKHKLPAKATSSRARKTELPEVEATSRMFA